MVHVSVQLFSNEQLAFRMVKEENLLFKIIFVLSKMVGECLDNYSLEIEGSYDFCINEVYNPNRTEPETLHEMHVIPATHLSEEKILN